MIDNFWIFVTQLVSLLVYVCTALGLYRLLAAQKDATIEAKNATIENLETQLQQVVSKVPDILVTLLQDRLKISQEELERLKRDKDKSADEIRLLRERQEITSEIVHNLFTTINVFQFISNPKNEDYKDFVVDVCGSVDEATKTIIISADIFELAGKKGKIINEKSDIRDVFVENNRNNTIIVSRIKHRWSYVFLKDNTIWIEKEGLAELKEKHSKIRSVINQNAL